MQKNRCVLAINGGSSSIKFALYEKADVLVELLSGAIDNIGSEKAGLSFTKANDAAENNIAIDASSHGKAVEHLKACLDKHVDFDLVVAIGHRIVHGMSHIEPELITDDLIMELKKISSIDPEHLHGQIALIEMFKKWYPALQQVTCFDTSFHTTMPVVAKLLAIPRTYYKKGVQRYGFHGLSYAFLMEELHRICGETSKTEKIILAHLGSGASLAAVKNGKSIDTSMGFTPTSGLPMGTRTGDLDPGVVSYLMEHEKLDAKAFNDTVIHKSGLLGISETNSNMKSLIELEDLDYRAKEA
ncbi:MAG TPA: acetate/propionate family kinase, partial [Pricia sp.]|nr:acetate/propionate family kinase [Pricia sp.]